MSEEITLKPNDRVSCGDCRKWSTVIDAIYNQWNTIHEDGVLVGFKCDECQTVEDSVEAQVNDATTDIVVVDGYTYTLPKGTLPSTDSEQAS